MSTNEPVEQAPTAVIATITGKDLLDRLDSLSTSFRDFTQKLDDVPSHVADLELRMRVQESMPRPYVTWSGLGAVLTLLCVVLAVVAAFLNR